MKAIILAAGQGTRLRPHTNDRPKCMVLLAGRPLIEHQLAVLESCGVRDIIIVGGYAADKLPSNRRVILNERFETTNMVHSLFCARDWLVGDEALLVSYGDIVYEPKVLQAVIESPGEIALSIDLKWQRYWELRNPNPLDDAESLKLDPQGFILELGKKPKNLAEIQGQYMGLFKIARRRVAELAPVFDAMDRSLAYDGKDFDNMYMTSFLQHLINLGWPVRAVPVENGWLETDTVQDLELYEAMFAEGRLDSFCRLNPGE